MEKGGSTGYNNNIMPSSGIFIDNNTTIILDNVIDRTNKILYGGKKKYYVKRSK